MAEVSKAKLRKEIAGILKNADLTKTTAKKVRQQLEEKLDCDLADQKKVVDELVMEILQDKQGGGKKKKKVESEEEEEENDNEDGDNDNDVDEDSEEDTKKKKKPAPKRAAAKKKKNDSDESDADDDDDEYSPAKKAKTSSKKGGGKKKKKGSGSESDEDWGKKKKRKGGGGGGKGYTRTCTLSPELAKLMGEDAMPRHEVVKKMWALIKERNLYDPENKQFAICDSEMLEVIGEERFRIFGMMKFLKKHFVD